MPSAAMLSPIFRQRAALTTRPVPEAETCIVYCPENPRLYSLNLGAWLVFELCRGLTVDEITKAYGALTVPPLTWQQAEGQVAAALAQLQTCRLVEAGPADPEALSTDGD